MTNKKPYFVGAAIGAGATILLGGVALVLVAAIGAASNPTGAATGAAGNSTGKKIPLSEHLETMTREERREFWRTYRP